MAVDRLSKNLGGGKVHLSEEMDATLKRIQESRNVVGVLVVSPDGMPLKSSLDSTLTVQVKMWEK